MAGAQIDSHRYKKGMGDEDVALARRAIELWIAGERDAAWALWADDCVGIAPTDWPEPGPWHGRDQLQSQFESWNTAFGPDWTRHLAIREITELSDGRILIELEFRTSGSESRLPVDQELAVINTTSEGRIVKGEFFLDWAESRNAAGLA